MNKIRIAAAIASQHGITLYLENGGTMNLPNDSWRTSSILKNVAPKMAANQIVEIDLDDFSVEKQIEDKTAGVIRFIKKTMDELQGMLAELEGSKDTPKANTEPTRPAAAVPQVSQKTESVAVVKTKTGDVEVPGMDNMTRHMEHAVQTGNTKGLERFMVRIAAVSKDRGHTVQELLKFMERGDLPIADDGCIVAYKVLKTKGVDKDVFVDCHTSKVEQNLGSRVSMDPKLVDRSRSTECSVGLHIARRGYLHGFTGNVITLVKVAPEDVVAVPNGEPDKMRAAAYHIVGVLPNEVHATLRMNKPMTGNDIASKMLADVIAGNHVKVLKEVRIGAARGGDVTSKPTRNADKPAPKEFQSGKAKAIDDANNNLTPKAVREMARAAPEPVKETKAERDARKKREKRAAAKKVVKEVPASEARFHAFGSPKAAAKIAYKATETTLATLAATMANETKAERDARKKREKRAAEKAAKAA